MVLGLRFFWSALSGIAGYFSRSMPAHPTYLTNQQGIHSHPNLALLATNTRDIVYKRVPAPFALISNPLAHSWKLAVVLGESGATVPSDSDSYLPSPALFQHPLARAKSLADTFG